MQYFYVYILKCADGSYYTGHTDNLEKRLFEHKNSQLKCYTSTRLPIELVFTETTSSRYEAISMEMQIKGWSRKKKEALIKKNWNEIKKLASIRKTK